MSIVLFLMYSHGVIAVMRGAGAFALRIIPMLTKANYAGPGLVSEKEQKRQHLRQRPQCVAAEQIAGRRFAHLSLQGPLLTLLTHAI